MSVTLPTFNTSAPVPATVGAPLLLAPSGRCRFLVTLAGVKLGQVRMQPSRGGAPAAWVHGSSFGTFDTPEAAAANLYALRHRRELGRVRPAR